jgi:hypothetical protein
MSHKRRNREVQQVVRRVLPLVPTGQAVGKAEFEAIHAEILRVRSGEDSGQHGAARLADRQGVARHA